jgi:hypothetical protein
VQSPETLLEKREAHASYKHAIRVSQQRAIRDAALKVQMNLAPIHILTRGKASGTHQNLNVWDPDAFFSHWKSVFADSDPLPPPPQPDAPRPEPDPQPDSSPAEPDPPEAFYSRLQEALAAVSSTLFTSEDVINAVNSMQNRAPGDDGIPISVFKGAFKSGDEVVRAIDLHAPFLAEMFNFGVQTGLPTWTKQGLGKWLHKKGSKDDPDNYRLIVLQPILMKVLERMVDLRLRGLIDREEVGISVEQGGFMTERSTYDSIFLLQSLQDGARHLRQPLYTAFLDVKKAFDSVSHRRLLRVLSAQGVPDFWVGLIHCLLTDRYTTLGDVEVPIERGTPQGSPLSPLLFILFMEPLIKYLRAGSVGVELSPGTFLQCLLFADDICLVASSLEDLQRMLDLCTKWAVETRMVFNTTKSDLLHLAGAPPDANVLLSLSGRPLKWKTEVTYLGVPIKLGRRASTKLPVELPKLWAALYRAGAALNPKVPIPLTAQLRIINSEVLAGAMYPAAVHDLDYVSIDRFVNSLLRRLTGCEPRTSATFLRCETGLLPSKFLGHCRAVQYWRHINHYAWFAPLLPLLHGQGPQSRLRNIASLYGLVETTELSLGVAYPLSKDRWHCKVREAVGDAAAKYLQTAASQRHLPAPKVFQQKKKGPLKLVVRPYITEGAELAKYGVAFRQSAYTGRFGEGDTRRTLPCKLCNRPGKYQDPSHAVECSGVPESFRLIRKAFLARLGLLQPSSAATKHLCDVPAAHKVPFRGQVSMKAALAFMRKTVKVSKLTNVLLED